MTALSHPGSGKKKQHLFAENNKTKEIELFYEDI